MNKGDHPSYEVMISTAIRTLRKKEGSSLVAIENFIQGNYDVPLTPSRFRLQVRLGIRRAVENGTIERNRGSYVIASGIAKKPSKQANKEEASSSSSDDLPEEQPVKEEPKKKRVARSKSPKKKESSESEEEEEVAPKKTARGKKKEEDTNGKEEVEKGKEKEKPKQKRAAGKRKKDDEESGEDKKEAKKQSPKKQSPKKQTPKKQKGAQEEVQDKTVEVQENVLPNIVTSGVAFNTTDMIQVRNDVKGAIEKILTDDNVRVGIIANRGWKDTKYNLETLDFSDDPKEITKFVEGSFGEGSDWLAYYKQVLDEALNLSWADNRAKMLILIGDEGIKAVTNQLLQASVGKLATLGVKVYAFHHTQLFLLEEVLNELN